MVISHNAETYCCNAQAQKYSNLKGGEVLAAVAQDFPKLEIKRPTFYSGSNNVASSNVAAVQLSATGVSVSPCAIPIGPVGASINPTVSPLLQHGPELTCINASPQSAPQQLPGSCEKVRSTSSWSRKNRKRVPTWMQAVNVGPTLISISATGVNVQPQALNVSPDLIVVGPYDTTIAGQVNLPATPVLHLPPQSMSCLMVRTVLFRMLCASLAWLSTWQALQWCASYSHGSVACE